MPASSEQRSLLEDYRLSYVRELQENHRVISEPTDHENAARQNQLCQDALAASWRQNRDTREIWNDFKSELGFEAHASETAQANYRQSELSELLREARQIQAKYAQLGYRIAIGAPDDAADFTVVTAAPLLDQAVSALRAQEFQSRHDADFCGSDAPERAFALREPLLRENAIAEGVSAGLEHAPDEARLLRHQLDDLRNNLDAEGAASRDPAQLTAPDPADYPALGIAQNLDREQNTDLDTVSFADADRGASRYNNHPPEYQPELSRDENIRAIAGYLQPRLLRALRESAPDDGDNPMRDFANHFSQPYPDGHGPAAATVMNHARRRLADAVTLYRYAETDLVDCAAAVADLAHCSQLMQDYRPEPCPESQHASYVGQALIDILADDATFDRTSTADLARAIDHCFINLIQSSEAAEAAHNAGPAGGGPSLATRHHLRALTADFSRMTIDQSPTDFEPDQPAADLPQLRRRLRDTVDSARYLPPDLARPVPLESIPPARRR